MKFSDVGGGFDPQFSDLCAWDEGEFKRTFAAVWADVLELMRCWEDQGLRRAQTLAVHGLPAYETWVCLLAAAAKSCRIAPLPNRLRLDQLAGHLGALPFDYTIGFERGEAMPSLAAPRREGEGETSCDRHSFETIALDPQAPYLLIFSSGSSGQVKAVQHCLQSLSAAARASLDFYQARPGQSWLLSLELSHIGGFQIAWRAWLGGLRCCSGFATHEIEEALARFQPSFVSLVPTQLSRLLLRESSSAHLRAAEALLLGGAACPPSLLDEARRQQLPLSITYGSSETAAQVAAFPPGELPDAEDAVGYLLSHWEARVIDGRLALRGEALCQGWWLEGKWIEARDESGFYLSADRASLAGSLLRIAGRSDDIFQVAGENLSPREITRVLEPLTAAGAWIVVPRADSEYGQVPVLIYRGLLAPPALHLIEARLAAALPGLKRPRRIYWHRSGEESKPSRAYYTQLLCEGTTLESTW